ncbi:MAG: hypothetical protein QW841_01640 [Candidatus Aenigmatarchaeota archaeon]
MKGLAFAISEVFQIAGIIACIIFVIFLWKGYYFDVGIQVNEGREERSVITIANILLSSPRLAYEEDGRIQRAVLDSSKLSSISANDLINEVSYPKTKYKVSVKNLRTGNTWEIKPDLTDYKLKYEKSFPVSIKENEQIDLGIMTVKLYNYEPPPEEETSGRHQGGRERI